MVLGLLTDLFFSARIRETAKQLGLACEIVREPAALLEKSGAAKLIIVDLNLKTADAVAAVRALREASSVPIVGYLFDVQEDLMAAAEEAGCDRVLSRGQLTRLLPQLLSGEVPIAVPCH